MNFKSHQQTLVLNTPESFHANILAMRDLTSFHYQIEEVQHVTFVIAFVTQQSQIDELVPVLSPRLEGDALVWFCYPKGTSKKYQCDFNRDTGWQVMSDFRLEGVRMVAVDQDWSALRFRRVEYIKTMKRRESFALSKEGKAKAAQKGR
ncbi:MAG: hypothetical protein AAFO69_15810 [Bacteroidota bacterium]